ncbi:hypothetical protein HWV62_34381 [Athelia sp. TMB]|nr:hypothetical protein HWV62_34381 [Athelia sp. TMB]
MSTFQQTVQENEEPNVPSLVQRIRGSFTPEELVTLNTWLPRYQQAKRTNGKQLPGFWPPFETQYFKDHPLRALTLEEVAQGMTAKQLLALVRKRQREWFNNHSRTTTSGSGRRAMLELVKDSKSRLLSITHAYNALHKERLGPIIIQEWTESVISGRTTDEEKSKPVPPVPINFRNAMLKRMFAEESADVKTEVEAWRQARHANDAKKEEGDDEESRRLATANRYHRAQQALIPSLQCILENIEKQTGLIGVVTLVGPEPGRGGNLGAFTIYHGENKLGHDFGHYYTDEKWKVNVEEPLLEFAATVYSQTECHARRVEATASSDSRQTSKSRSPSTIPSQLPLPSRSQRINRTQDTLEQEPSPAQTGDSDDDYEDEDDNDNNYDFFSKQLASTVPSAASVASPDQDRDTEPDETSNNGVQEPNRTPAEAEEESHVVRVNGNPTLPERLPEATWDNGESITAEERAVLLAMDTDEKRRHAMVIRRREREQLEDGEIEKVTPIVAKLPAASKKPSEKAKKAKVNDKSKATAPEKKKDSQGPVRRSSRQKGGNTELSALPVSTNVDPPPAPPVPNTLDATTAEPSPISTSSVTSTLKPGADKENLPEWIEEALGHLHNLCDDARWLALLVKWVEFERRLGFPNGSRSRAHVLSQTERPKPIGIWIQHNRPWDKLPIPRLQDAVEDFSISWWLWWRSLQPVWRADSLSHDLRRTGEFNWDETRKGGSNGFFLVILALGLWFEGDKRTNTKGKGGFGEAIGDVEWVVDQMDIPPSLGKRRRGEAHTDPPISKRGRKSK